MSDKSIKKRATATLIMVVLLCTTLCHACSSGETYSSFATLPIEGWQRSDTLTFHTDTISASGTYVRALHLRTLPSADYPYRDVCVELRQYTLPDSVLLPTDTLCFDIYDQHGAMEGSGLVYHQHDFTLDTVRLQRGQVSVMQVRHCMYRNPLTAITEIGFSCRRIAD